jgi:hypothetical protein
MKMIAKDFERLANFGYTEAGSAIVDAIWFSGAYSSPATQIGMVLICDLAGCWKAYIGGLDMKTNENLGAEIIAAHGAKVPCAIAQAAFPGRFEAKDYDT